jgi:hypothetical protein
MYERFKQLDGTHPWRDVSPDGFVDYQVRCRSQGRVLYFNFPLAKELELIPPDHPSIINKELEQTILEHSRCESSTNTIFSMARNTRRKALNPSLTWRRATCKPNTIISRAKLRATAQHLERSSENEAVDV